MKSSEQYAKDILLTSLHFVSCFVHSINIFNPFLQLFAAIQGCHSLGFHPIAPKGDRFVRFHQRTWLCFNGDFHFIWKFASFCSPEGHCTDTILHNDTYYDRIVKPSRKTRLRKPVFFFFFSRTLFTAEHLSCKCWCQWTKFKTSEQDSEREEIVDTLVSEFVLNVNL